ncbi:chemotaxis protein CheY [Oceanicaulis sp. HTCC2633]|uniref:response regulator n=1 Tax=Oceanicaulis sp. HTCC2633 TaxID=314254 RepID=UPI000066D6D8|nr:response regulator [Oceanicaulis sp. HTCC2633]EAP90992.1 chemotaxis protein CheY [Oceanicaulis sp. HTCC2633]
MPTSTDLSDLRRTFLSRAHDDIQALHARLQTDGGSDVDPDLLDDVARLSHRLLGSYGSFGFPAMARNFELIEEVALTQLSSDLDARPALKQTRLPDMIADMLDQAGVLRDLGYEPRTEDLSVSPLVDPRDNKRILFVDDDTNLHGLAEMYLKEEGYSSVIYETCAKNAVEYLSAHSVDAIICDWQLEGDNGLDLLRKVRSGGLQPSRETPFIFMTVPSSKQAIERAGLYRPDGYLLKPFDAHRLHGVLGRALAN